MLTQDNQETAVQATPAPLSRSRVTNGVDQSCVETSPMQARLAKVLRIEWLGQTVASVCWIGSVMAYGITSSGDWLQLLAASSWLLANIAAAMTIKVD